MAGHWLPEMKVLAGADDGGLQEPGSPVRKVLWESITAFGPQVLFLTPCAADVKTALAQVEALARLPGFWSLPATESGQMVLSC
ncbi:unnamed protein product [Closterium sp. Yama58-4]|nr:unnamed protein product [Closterium sp. Yama58-4]